MARSDLKLRKALASERPSLIQKLKELQAASAKKSAKKSKNVRTGKETRTQRIAKTAKYQGGRDTTKEISLKDIEKFSKPMKRKRGLMNRHGKLRSYKKGGSVGSSVKTYASGGYVEGK